MAKQLYGKQAYRNMTLELNASDDRGIAVVRQEIQEFASTRRIFSSGVKLVILDECDAMTKDAQYALRRSTCRRNAPTSSCLTCVTAISECFTPRLTPRLCLPPSSAPAVIEKYTRNTRFCLICNYVSKIIPALQSRCTRFRFPPLPHDCIRDRLNHIAQAENLKVDEGGVEAIIAISMGDMRKCVNILQVSCVPTAVFPRFASCVDGRNALAHVSGPTDVILTLWRNSPIPTRPLRFPTPVNTTHLYQ